ncbi:MAG: hypothetical protein JO022_15360 [Acidobacteriaceae bacterium]|nr:hypothetical protein [Acidobacteriaceae bacterium]
MAARPRGPAGFTVSVRRLHTWLGLLSFAHLMIYGVAGLTATFQTSKERPKIVRNVRYEPFRADPNATDREAAAAVYRKLDLPFTRPMPDWFLRYTVDHHLLLDFYQINGIDRVVPRRRAAAANRGNSQRHLVVPGRHARRNPGRRSTSAPPALVELL